MRADADDPARVRDPANELLFVHPASVAPAAHSGSSSCLCDGVNHRSQQSAPVEAPRTPGEHSGLTDVR